MTVTVVEALTKEQIDEFITFLRQTLRVEGNSTNLSAEETRRRFDYRRGLGYRPFFIIQGGQRIGTFIICPKSIQTVRERAKRAVSNPFYVRDSGRIDFFGLAPQFRRKPKILGRVIGAIEEKAKELGIRKINAYVSTTNPSWRLSEKTARKGRFGYKMTALTTLQSKAERITDMAKEKIRQFNPLGKYKPRRPKKYLLLTKKLR